MEGQKCQSPSVRATPREEGGKCMVDREGAGSGR